MNFEAIYGRVMRKCHHAVTETALLADIKDDINERYHEIWSALGGADPAFGRASTILTTVDDYTTGTVETNGTTTIIGTDTIWTSAMVGRKFKLTSDAEIYTIATWVSATEITLDRVITNDDDDELGYSIYDDELSLPSDCSDNICLSIQAGYTTLKKIGLTEMRGKQVASPFGDSESGDVYPQYWAYLSGTTIIVYPAPTEVYGIQLDYTKKFTELVNTPDEPLIPVDYHRILIYGGMADLMKYDDNPEWEKMEAKFQIALGQLKAKNAGNVDLCCIKLNVKRT